MKLIDLAGLMKMSATNSFASMIAAVLLVSSQITTKSNIPRSDVHDGQGRHFKKYFGSAHIR